MSEKPGLPEQQNHLSPDRQALLEKRLQAAIQRSAQQPVIPRRARQGFAPLSFGQEGLWFISQLDAASPVYNRPVALRLVGDLDQSALQRTLDEILKRHEVLRARYRVDLGRPLQEINPSAIFKLPLVDLSALPVPEREKKAREFANEQARMPVNLSKSPLLRACLIRLALDEHILLLVFHHITFDAWSERVLLKELSALYPAFSSGAASPLPELPIQYADYAAWQHERAETSQFKDHLDYWKGQLADLPPAFELPADFPRPPHFSNRGARLQLLLPADLVSELTAFCLRRNITLSMLFLAAYLTLLNRYSGQTEALIGMPVAGRTMVELEGLIGLFINSLALHCNLAGSPSFSELLERVQSIILEAINHQEAPLERLVAEINPRRDLSRSSFFQVMFNYKNIPDRFVQIAGLAVTLYDLDLETSPYDLTLEILPQAETVGCAFIYNTDLYHPATIERFAANFLQLLHSVLATPDCPIAQLPILSATERQELLVVWNQTARPQPENLCIHQVIEAQAAAHPDASAVVSGSLHLSYAELNAQANQLARYLQQAGVNPGDLVGVSLDRSIEMVVSLLGILKAGAGYLPLELDQPADRLARIVQISKAALVLAHSRSAQKLAHCTARQVYMDIAWSEIARLNAENLSSAVKPEYPAYVIFTSGSTGAPKGVVISHRALCNHVVWANQAFDLRPGDSCLQMANLSFDISVSEIFDTLAAGGRSVLRNPGVHWDAGILVDLILRFQITHLQIVPSALRLIVENVRFSDCASLRHVISGGEILPVDLALQFARSSKAALHNLYGPSETCIDTAHLDLSNIEQVISTGAQLWPGRPVSIGRPISNARVYILDADLQPAPVGVGGEIYIAGAGLASGYLNDPVQTAQSFVPNPYGWPGERFYRTGDWACYTWDGNIRFLGRVDEQVKLRGYRIELGEIENILLALPQVKQAVVGVQRADTAAASSESDTLAAYIVPEQPGNLTAQQVRDYLKRKLPDYMLPSSVFFLNTLPLSANGKIDRRALASLNILPATDRDFLTPQTSLQQVLAGIWSDILNVKRIGLQDNFFELGGNSMLAIRLVDRIEDLFKIHLDLHSVFQATDLRELANGILQKVAEPGAIEEIAHYLLELNSLSDEEARAANRFTNKKG